MMLKWLNEIRMFFVVFLIAVLILAVPLLVRLFYFNGIMIGSESYYHARNALDIASRGIPASDGLVVGQRPYKPDLYHLLLALFSRIASIELASVFVPVFFGLTSLLLFYLILKRLNFDLRIRFLSLVLLVTSPAFIVTFTFSSSHCFAIFLFCLALYLFLYQKWYFILLSSLIFISGVFFSFFNTVIIALFVLFYGFYEKKRLNICLALFFFVLVAGILYHSPYFVTENVEIKNMLADFLSDLGADIGFGLFTIILAGLGFIIKWMEKKRLFVFYAMAVFFLLSIFFLRDYGNAYLNFVLVLFASYGLLWLMEYKWELSVLKNLTILVIVCGLIFSSLSYINRIPSSPPDEAAVRSLEWLHSYASPEDVILSHYSYGFWIQYFTHNKVFMDGFKTLEHEKLFEDYNTMLYSRNLKLTSDLLSEYGIKYILISDGMKSGMVWSRGNEGLLFILENSESFRRIYDEQGIEIWEFIS